jgi:MYXO-CTERM domain-containing protein
MRLSPAEGFPYSLCSPLDVDAGVTTRDASVPDAADPVDAAEPPEDAGMTESDAGAAGEDAGAEEGDGGSAGDGIAAEELNDALWALLCTCSGSTGKDSTPALLLLAVAVASGRGRRRSRVFNTGR